jgi:hypothetical protein
MNKNLSIFITLACLLAFSRALYNTQVGMNDWNIRNIGDLDKVLFTSQKVAFKSKDNVIGSFGISRGIFNLDFS